jgi:uncharacterized membrane protein
MPDTANNCPSCGKGAGAAAPAAQSSGGGLADNVAGLLAYITILPAIFFLVVEPYNKNKFIRFHSFQCLFMAAAWFACIIVLMFLGMILSFVSFLGLLVIPLYFLVGFGFFVMIVICLLKAYQGQMWKVPVIGNLAEKQANAV